MNRGATEPQIDELLAPFLNGRSDAESEAVLEQIIVKHAQPVIADIISFKLKVSSSRWGGNHDRHEVEDVSNDVIVSLIRTLRNYKSSTRAKPISNLRSYVAMMAYNASDEYLRQKYPKWYSLKNRVRYILTHKAGLALWEGENRKVLCGFSRLRQPFRGESGPLRERRDALENFLFEKFPNTALAQLNSADLVAAILEFANSPLEIDELVTVTAEILGIRSTLPQETERENPRVERHSQLSSHAPVIAESFDRRQRLQKVWSEILQLPFRQRTALLLNLRDESGGAAIVMLPMLRVATIRQIAEALVISAEELAEVWGRLPLDDAAIGKRLNASTQQVSNLRKCARERLARRFESARRT